MPRPLPRHFRPFPPGGPLFLVVLLASTLPAAPAPPAENPGGEVRPVFLREWGGRGDAAGQFHFPIGIAISAAGEVFVTDNVNHRVQKFDADGKLLAHFPVLPNPGGIALDKDGNLYLTHFRASAASTEKDGDRLSVYSPDGRLLRQWGRRGAGEGEFDCPGGVAVARDGSVYVADQTNHRVQVFDVTGKFRSQWGRHGNDPGEFGGRAGRGSRVGGPQFLALDTAGHVWTTEGANCRVQKFTPAGKPLLAWGTAEDRPGGFGGLFAGFKDRKPGSLLGPIALCIDKGDRPWVGAVSGRVQRFAADGRYLGGLGGEQGSKAGQFYAPHGLALDGAGRLYVVDTFNHRVQKFDVGR